MKDEDTEKLSSYTVYISNLFLCSLCQVMKTKQESERERQFEKEEGGWEKEVEEWVEEREFKNRAEKW